MLHVDGVSWEVTVSKWGGAWVPLGEESDDPKVFLDLFGPLFESGPFTGDAVLDTEHGQVPLEYEFGDAEAVSSTSGTVTMNGEVVYEVVFNASSQDGLLPDPNDGLLMPEDLVGGTANPVVAAWHETRFDQ